MKSRLLPTPLAILILATLVQISPLARADDESTKQAAVAAMTPWLKLIDGGEYGPSYDAASRPFQEALTREAWITALDDVRKPLGELESREILSSALLSTLPDGTKGTYVLAQFASSFANLAQATETVTFEQNAEGTWLAGGYFIRPN